ESEPSSGSADRAVYIPQGRTLGGSSAINGMIYNRGHATDFDTWAQAGNGGVDSQYRGREGPLPVTDTDWRKPFVEAFIDGVAGLGIPRNPDYNGASQAGVGYMQRVIEN